MLVILGGRERPGAGREWVMGGAEAAGMVVGRLIILAVPIVMIVVGRRRQKESGGQRGGPLKIGGVVLLVLVVLGILGQAATQVSTAP
jgi:hypothetical protein